MTVLKNPSVAHSQVRTKQPAADRALLYNAASGVFHAEVHHLAQTKFPKNFPVPVLRASSE